MDEFALVVTGGLAVLLVALLALGRYYPGSGAEQVDWRPTRSAELEAELELDDVDQMIEAQNERRRASGREEISEQGVRATVEAGERWRRERADRYVEEPPQGDDADA